MRRGAPVLAGLLLSSLACVSPSLAFAYQPPQGIVGPSEDSPDRRTDAADSDADAGTPAVDPCLFFGGAGGSWIDRMQRMVFQSVCGSAVWFDSFFGDERVYEETDSPRGRLGLGLLWDNRDGFDIDASLKVKVALPQAENRLNAFLRRGDRDEYIADRADSSPALPDVFRAATDDEWLLGLGYNPLRSSRRRLDFDVGIKLDLPPEPFVKARYRRQFRFSDQLLGRFRQTVFWELDEGFGTTSRFDLEHLLGPRFLIRWRNRGTFSQFIEGIEWRSSVALYHYLGLSNTGGSRAMAYELTVSGETDKAVPVDDYGVRVTFRQSVLREWFYLELRGSLTWPREEIFEKRKATPGLLVGFEMKFGRES